MNKIFLLAATVTTGLLIQVSALAQGPQSFDCSGTAANGFQARFSFSILNNGAKLGYVSNLKPYFFSGKSDLVQSQAYDTSCTANRFCYTFRELQSELDNYKNGRIYVDKNLLATGSGQIHLGGDNGVSSAGALQSFDVGTLDCVRSLK